VRIRVKGIKVRGNGVWPNGFAKSFLIGFFWLLKVFRIKGVLLLYYGYQLYSGELIKGFSNISTSKERRRSLLWGSKYRCERKLVLASSCDIAYLEQSLKRWDKVIDWNFGNILPLSAQALPHLRICIGPIAIPRMKCRIFLYLFWNWKVCILLACGPGT
jgi:hypothetical protein